MAWIEVEVDGGGNSDLSMTRVFEALEAPRAVCWVEAAFRPDGWEGPCDVVGWSDGGPSPAQAAKVADSGDGVVVLVYGGDEGVRLRPSGSEAAWSLEDPEQWGEPCLLLELTLEVR